MAEKSLKRTKRKHESDEAAPPAAANGSAFQWPSRSPWPKRRRKQTISVALAASVVDIAQTLELATVLAGQLSRTAAIFNIDEVVVIDDADERGQGSVSGSAAFLARVLQFMETPQYLRKALIPMHKDLRAAGLLPTLDAPHHLRSSEWAAYREAVVLATADAGSICDVGLPQLAVVSEQVQKGQRVTVELGEASNATQPADSLTAELEPGQAAGCKAKQALQGRLVDSLQPLKRKGWYWGYTVRIASGLTAALAEAPFQGGYDLRIGTSERGSTETADKLELRPFTHAIIVLGGPQGLEQCLSLDANAQGADVSKLFDFWLNTCAGQGSRTIRTEEALLISLTYLQPALMNCALRQ